ncbi:MULTISPECIES: hypothetical protein [Vibrio]|uniref:hypothetical protein n=1 Tax=Vibrio TaxID=662 RepID=UPI0012E03FF6|nr:MULTISPECIES: hypothetical protein [Vibrio]
MDNEENNSWTNLYRKGILFSLTGFICVCLCFLIGWNGWFNFFDDKPALWFQRSGSIMLVFLVIADYHVYKMSNDVDDLDGCPPYAVQTKDKYRVFVRPLPAIASLLTLIATLVCGYGDLIYTVLS